LCGGQPKRRLLPFSFRAHAFIIEAEFNAMSPAIERNTEVKKESIRKVSPQPEPDVTVKDDIKQSIFTSPSHEDIAVLAYSYWLERGQPDGSAEEDWLRAESELSEQRHQTAGSR
jgi:hypothetical protein